MAGVFDLETEDWDKYVVGGFLNSDEQGEPDKYYDFPTEQDGADFLLAQHGDWWAHNGGIFDNKWALDRANERGLSCVAIPAGSRIVELRVGKNLRLLDSKALTKISLEELTKGADVSKEKLQLPCVCEQSREGESCGGYCSIRRVMPAEQFRRLREYLRADCFSLFGALRSVKRFAEQRSIDLGITVGGAAWRTAKRWLDLPSANLDKSDHAFARAGYFGGRVQIFRKESRSGFEKDVASMYPSRLATRPVPVGNHQRHMGRKKAEPAYSNGLPGIYRAKVTVPESFIPPLPFRHGGRIHYAHGELEGTWAKPELDYAQSVGVVLEEVYECVVWEEEKVLFRRFVEEMFAIRKSAPGGKSGPIGTFIKYIINSLTGKFGARPDNDTLDINPDVVRVCVCRNAAFNGCTCGAHEPYGDSPDVFLSTKYRLASCGHVEWAAYLTAEARVEWHRQALSLGNGGVDLVYGDTDSIYSERNRTRNEGFELGQWEPKGPYLDFVAIAPKVYWYRRPDEKGEIELHVRGKGLRLDKQAERAKAKLEPAAKGGVSEVFARDGIHGTWQGARVGKFFQKQHTTRKVSQGFGDRYLNADGVTTRAPHISEVLQCQP